MARAFRGAMKQMILYSLVIGALFASRGLVQAEHDKACKNVHGRVTVVTENSVTVNDTLYKVGKSTRIVKDEQVVKLEKIVPGDVVCLDPHGQDDIATGREVAAVTVLSAKDAATTEKEVVREKVIREKEKIREEK